MSIAPFKTSSTIHKEHKTKPLATKSPVNLSRKVVKTTSIRHLHHSADQISLQLEYCRFAGLSFLLRAFTGKAHCLVVF